MLEPLLALQSEFVGVTVDTGVHVHRKVEVLGRTLDLPLLLVAHGDLEVLLGHLFALIRVVNQQKLQQALLPLAVERHFVVAGCQMVGKEGTGLFGFLAVHGRVRLQSHLVRVSCLAVRLTQTRQLSQAHRDVRNLRAVHAVHLVKHRHRLLEVLRGLVQLPQAVLLACHALQQLRDVRLVRVRDLAADHDRLREVLHGFLVLALHRAALARTHLDLEDLLVARLQLLREHPRPFEPHDGVLVRVAARRLAVRHAERRAERLLVALQNLLVHVVRHVVVVRRLLRVVRRLQAVAHQHVCVAVLQRLDVFARERYDLLAHRQQLLCLCARLLLVPPLVHQRQNRQQRQPSLRGRRAAAEAVRDLVLHGGQQRRVHLVVGVVDQPHRLEVRRDAQAARARRERHVRDGAAVLHDEQGAAELAAARHEVDERRQPGEGGGLGRQVELPARLVPQVLLVVQQTLEGGLRRVVCLVRRLPLHLVLEQPDEGAGEDLDQRHVQRDRRAGDCVAHRAPVAVVAPLQEVVHDGAEEVQVDARLVRQVAQHLLALGRAAEDVGGELRDFLLQQHRADQRLDVAHVAAQVRVLRLDAHGVAADVRLLLPLVQRAHQLGTQAHVAAGERVHELRGTHRGRLLHGVPVQGDARHLQGAARAVVVEGHRRHQEGGHPQEHGLPFHGHLRVRQVPVVLLLGDGRQRGLRRREEACERRLGVGAVAQQPLECARLRLRAECRDPRLLARLRRLPVARVGQHGVVHKLDLLHADAEVVEHVGVVRRRLDRLRGLVRHQPLREEGHRLVCRVPFHVRRHLLLRQHEARQAVALPVRLHELRPVRAAVHLPQRHGGHQTRPLREVQPAVGAARHLRGRGAAAYFAVLLRRGVVRGEAVVRCDAADELLRAALVDVRAVLGQAGQRAVVRPEHLRQRRQRRHDVDAAAQVRHRAVQRNVQLAHVRGQRAAQACGLVLVHLHRHRARPVHLCGLPRVLEREEEVAAAHALVAVRRGREVHELGRRSHRLALELAQQHQQRHLALLHLLRHQRLRLPQLLERLVVVVRARVRLLPVADEQLRRARERARLDLQRRLGPLRRHRRVHRRVVLVRRRQRLEHTPPVVHDERVLQRALLHAALPEHHLVAARPHLLVPERRRQHRKLGRTGTHARRQQHLCAERSQVRCPRLLRQRQPRRGTRRLLLADTVPLQRGAYTRLHDLRHHVLLAERQRLRTPLHEVGVRHRGLLVARRRVGRTCAARRSRGRPAAVLRAPRRHIQLLRRRGGGGGSGGRLGGGRGGCGGRRCRLGGRPARSSRGPRRFRRRSRLARSRLRLAVGATHWKGGEREKWGG
eukprot:Rhum_TRINITY_DN15090_c3_g1::Rhum_TRINITY_DN15090_c3_g1_i1::g.134530::m.134530